jgi:hypothetical protein
MRKCSEATQDNTAATITTFPFFTSSNAGTSADSALTRSCAYASIRSHTYT